MKFSQRMGIAPIQKEMQLGVMDLELKNGLWNVYYKDFLCKITITGIKYLYEDELEFAEALWHSFLKLDITTIPHHKSEFQIKLHALFNNTLEWFEIYDLLEFSVGWMKRKSSSRYKDIEFVEKINSILEREFSGYRFIEGYLVPVTNNQEINELQSAISSAGSFSALHGCNLHLTAALQKLSDKVNPDYRNSIKESISAVESLAKIIAGRPGDSLGASLDRIKGKLDIHPALERGFKSIYGYTSDEGGIRHAMTEAASCDFEDAKFMLIACSAFVNYLIGKARKAGISFASQADLKGI